MVREISPYVRNDPVVTQGDAFCVTDFVFPGTFRRGSVSGGEGADGRALRRGFLYLVRALP